MVHHTALGGSPPTPTAGGGGLGGGVMPPLPPIMPPTGFLPLPLRLTTSTAGDSDYSAVTTPGITTLSPSDAASHGNNNSAAAAAVAAMMQGMRLPLALTKKHQQIKSELNGLQHLSNGNGRTSPPQEEKEGKSKPIHCVVEQASSTPGRPVSPPGGGAGRRGRDGGAPCESGAELDTYAILPSSTLFSEVVRVALVKLGYTAAEAIGAKGAIQIRHWKPLAFDTITENPDATVDDILGDLTSVATLRIKLGSRTKSHSVDGVKEKLLQFLLQHSQSMLMSTGCPIDKTFLSAIGKGEYPATMPDEMRRSFERWYRDQTRHHPGGSPPSTASSSPESTGKENRLDPATAAALFGAHFVGSTPGSTYPTLRGELNTSASATTSPATHFSSRTRIRTSFDPDLEIPRLQRWFERNQHPTRDQMIYYLNELNTLESRRGRKPLDLTNIIYWFKNARAAQRRAHRSPEPCANNNNGINVSGDHNDSSLLEERLSPDTSKDERERDHKIPRESTPTPTTPPPNGTAPEDDDEVPLLPNRNAVYVVNEPLHLYKRESECDEGDGAVLHIEPEEPPSRSRPNTPTVNNNNNNNNNSDRNNTDSDMYQLDLDHPKNSPRESHDSGNASDGEHCTGATTTTAPPVVIAPCSPGSTPRDLSLGGGIMGGVGVKRSSECLESDLSEDEFDEDDDRKYDNQDRKWVIGSSDGYHGYSRSELNGGGSDRGSSPSSPSPSPGSTGNRLSPMHAALPHSAGIMPTHPLLTSPGVLGGTGTSRPPPPAHQQAAAAAFSLHHPHHPHHPHPHLPHPLNMHHLFTHPLYNHIDASALMIGAAPPRHYKDESRSPGSPPTPHSLSDDHRKKRSRVFIDPLTEIPKLEKWFIEDTHPSSYMIEKYTEELNRSEYRQRFPKLEPKNVQLWFKNHRAKVKRQRFEHGSGSGGPGSMEVQAAQ